MAMDECRGNQELDADEQKDPSLCCPVCSASENRCAASRREKRGEEKQEDSHDWMSHISEDREYARDGRGQPEIIHKKEMRPVGITESANPRWKQEG